MAGLFLLGRGGRFGLSHRHSVEKVPWVDEFRVGPGDVMVLHRTRFGSFGAGLPSGSCATSAPSFTERVKVRPGRRPCPVLFARRSVSSSVR